MFFGEYTPVRTVKISLAGEAIKQCRKSHHNYRHRRPMTLRGGKAKKKKKKKKKTNTDATDTVTESQNIAYQ